MSIDVNAEFAAERGAQAQAAQVASESWDQRVADGKLVPTSEPGYFKVNDPGSWDHGEVFQQVNGIATPQSGLDMREDGTAQLYTSVPTWHQLEGAGLIPGGTTDIDQVLDLCGGNYRVEKRQARYFDGDGVLREAPDRFITARTDTWDMLGDVGKIYTPIQNRAGFEFLLELIDAGEAVWESAGPLRGGRRFFISMKLPEDVVIDAGGINDHVQSFVVVMNSFDGSSPFMALVTPWRPVCGNTNRFAVRDAFTRWAVPHTTNAMTQVAEAQRTLGLSVKYYQRFAEEETVLARAQYSAASFDKLIADLWPLGANPTKNKLTIKAKREYKLHALHDNEVIRTGATAYAAEQAVTEFLDNVAPKRLAGSKLAAARATAIMEGSDDVVKNRLHQKLLQTVSRRR